MIIDEEYVISSFHLKSGSVFKNTLFHNVRDDFNFYTVDKEEDTKMKLYKRKKEVDEDGDDCIIEKLVIILSTSEIEFIKVKEISDIPEGMLEIVDIHPEETLE